MFKISASVLNSNLSSIGDEVCSLGESDIEMLHIDVMDGIFVPPITFGDVVVRSLHNRVRENEKMDIVFDTHLMISEPERVIPSFCEKDESGNNISDIITFHLEAKGDVLKSLSLIKKSGIKAGIAINPPTPVERLFPYIGIADMFILMSVNPGYGGQAFIAETLDKISILKNELIKKGDDATIEVDGGINPKTAKSVIDAGADILVVGSYLFKSNDRKAAIKTLRESV